MNDDDQVRSRFAHLAEQEFNAGSFERLLELREHRLAHDLDISGCSTAEEKCAAASRAIVDVLHGQGAVLRVSRIRTDELEGLARHVAVNSAIERSGMMEATDNPGLPQRNLASYSWKIVSHLRNAADRVETREGLETLLQDRWIDIRNSDTTRLLVYEINKDALVPKVVVIPNDYKRYNPFFVLLKNDAPLPTTVMRVLRAFNR